VFRGNFAEIPRMAVGGSQIDDHGTDIKTLRLYMLHSITGFGALHGRLIYHHKSRCRAGDLQKVRELRKRFESEQVRLYGS
jgi:hypothetical protein